MNYQFNDPCIDCSIKSMCRIGYKCQAKTMYMSLKPKFLYPVHIWTFIIVVVCAIIFKWI